MRHAILTLMCAGLTATVLTAQGHVGPGMQDADTSTAGLQTMKPSVYFQSTPGGTSNPRTLGDETSPFPIWDPNFTGVKRIVQVHATKRGMSGLAAGEYAMAMTVYGLNPKYGAKGTGQQVVMGKVAWSSTGQPSFSANTMAASLNVIGNVFGLMVDDLNGKRASVDHPLGPRWAYRANNGLNFPLSVALTGTTRRYIDPTVAYIDGVLGVFWVSSTTTITWSPVTETFSNGVLTAAAMDTTKSVIAIKTGNQPHSPTPVINHTNGDTQGLFFARVTSGDSDLYFSGSLPDASGGVRIHDSTGWSNNGALCGSRFLAAHTGHTTQMLEGRGSYASTNNNVDVSTTSTANINFQVVSPVNPKLNRFVSVLGIGVAFITPQTLGGLNGQLGINPLVIVNPIAVGTTGDESANYTVPAKAAAVLKGLTLLLQTATGPSLEQHGLTNTIALTLK